MIQDVRFGAKLLRKDWVFTLTAIATLAVCVGGNTVCLPMAAKLTIGGFAVQALAGSAWTRGGRSGWAPASPMPRINAGSGRRSARPDMPTA